MFFFAFHDPWGHCIQDGKTIISTAIDENDTETFTTIGTQPTTEISQTTTMTPIFMDDQNLVTYYKASQGEKGLFNIMKKQLY